MAAFMAGDLLLQLLFSMKLRHHAGQGRLADGGGYRLTPGFYTVRRAGCRVRLEALRCSLRIIL